MIIMYTHKVEVMVSELAPELERIDAKESGNSSRPQVMEGIKMNLVRTLGLTHYIQDPLGAVKLHAESCSHGAKFQVGLEFPRGLGVEILV